MRDEVQERGAAPVGVLSHLEGWEANLIVNMRLWHDGPIGQAQVWNEYACSFPKPGAVHEMQAFETLLTTLTKRSTRTLIRHPVGCACLGVDEAVFLNLVKTASDGHIGDAALIATLMTGPAQAEHIALLAGKVGEAARRLTSMKPAQTHARKTSNVKLLH